MSELLLVSRTFFFHPLISHLFLRLAFTAAQHNRSGTHKHTPLLHHLINSSPLLTHCSFTPISVHPLTGRIVLGSTAVLLVCECVFVSLTCATCGSLADRVTHITVTDEGSLRILAVPTQTDVWVQLTFVHV